MSPASESSRAERRHPVLRPLTTPSSTSSSRPVRGSAEGSPSSAMTGGPPRAVIASHAEAESSRDPTRPASTYQSSPTFMSPSLAGLTPPGHQRPPLWIGRFRAAVGSSHAVLDPPFLPGAAISGSDHLGESWSPAGGDLWPTAGRSWPPTWDAIRSRSEQVATYTCDDVRHVRMIRGPREGSWPYS